MSVKIKSLLLLFFTITIILGCTKDESMTTSPEIIEEEEEMEEPESSVCGHSIFCSPPISLDTTCVRMQMKIEGDFYKPIANYTCKVPSFALGYDQLWINGSIIFATKVVTLKMPPNIEPGSYNLLHNTDYDALYVPAIGADNFVATSGTLKIVEHDTVDNYILGGFDFVAENLNGATLPEEEFTEGCFEANY